MYSKLLAVSILVILQAIPAKSQGSIDLDSDSVIFDDFHYSSSKQLFGTNTWETGEGTTQSTPAWRRYNWDDLSFDRGDVTFSRGVMTLNVPAGESLTSGPGGSRRAKLPSVVMGMALGKGTYAARVRFHHLDDENYLISSFWAGSPNRYRAQDGTMLANELDPEFNSCFWHPGSPSCSGQTNNLMVVSNWEDGTVDSVYVNCFGSEGTPQSYYAKECVYGGSSLFVDRWWDIIWTWDGAEVTYILYSEQQDSSPISWSASATGYEEPIVLTGNLPVSDLVPQFLLKAAPLKADNDDTDLDNPLTLDVDWFYYSPSVVSTLSEYWSKIVNLKNDGHIRVNTTSYRYIDVRAIDTPHSKDVSIQGPSVIDAASGGTWTISMPPSGGIYDLEFAYELRDEITGSWMRPLQINNRSISVSNICGIDSIRISAKVANLYNATKADSETKTVLVEQSGCSGS